MDTTVGGIGAVIVAELRAAGYMESTVAQYAKTIKALTEFASGREYSTSLGAEFASMTTSVCTGRFRDPADRFAARPDEQTDLFGIDLNRLNAGRELAQVGAWRGKCPEHRLEDFDARIASLHDSGLRNFQRQTVDLQIELESGDAFGRARELEVHVTEVIFFTENVGDGDPFRDRAVARVFSHESAADSRNGCNNRHARIHQCKTAAADGGHRGGSVRGEDFADDANRVGEYIFRREHRNE